MRFCRSCDHVSSYDSISRYHRTQEALPQQIVKAQILASLQRAFISQATSFRYLK